MSDDEAGDDLEFDRTTDADGEEDPDIDEDLLDALEGDVVADDATEGDDESASEDSEEGSDEEDEDESEPSGEPTQEVEAEGLNSLPDPNLSTGSSSQTQSQQSKVPSPAPRSRTRSLSPAHVRRKGLYAPIGTGPRTYTVEAICAIPHPVPTHALASSVCMTHLLTGSDDGYIRDYDVFAAVNGKIFLTAPQRHHSGVVEGIMKAGHIRYWWENPDSIKFEGTVPGPMEPSLSPVYSLAMHSDALWTLAGTDAGHINLFTVRHEPGRLCHVMNGHRGPVSALAMEHDEKGFFSAGWDGEALLWDLNTGQIVRNFTAHGAQLAGIAVRPASRPYYSRDALPVTIGSNAFEAPPGQPRSRNNSRSVVTELNANSTVAGGSLPYSAPATSGSVPRGQMQEADAKSDASFDPLFDDEPDADGEADNGDTQARPVNESSIPTSQENQTFDPSSSGQSAPPQSFQSVTLGTAGSVAPPKNAPPLLDPTTYATFSPDVLMTTSIDGQIILWDKRVQSSGKGVGRLWMSEKTPPWCLSACWSADGGQIYAGRRNGTVDIWDTRQLGRSGPSGTPRLLKTLRNPLSSGVVACVVAFPDGRHVACASNDNIRLWNVAEAGEPDGSGKVRSGVQFKIIPGHHGGYVSQMIVDPGARFLVSASSNRGWHGDSTRTVFVHDIKRIQ